MPTTVIAATQLRYASGSSWTDGWARQGVYSTTRYQGAMLFPGLTALPYTNIAISQIRIKLTFGGSGGSGTKYVTIYEGTKDTISGHISDMRGSSVGAISVSGAYNATRTLTFNGSTNAGMFTQLRNFFAGGGRVLVLYVPTTRGTYSGGYCYDFLSVTAAEIELTYAYLRSDGSLTSSSVAAGGEAKLNITAYNSAYTHVVKWTFGGNTHSQNIAAGATSASYTIPLGWLSTIPNATSGSAQVSLETKSGSTSLGTYTYSFTITAPASVVPTIGSVTASPINDNSVLAGWGIYAQGKTKANLAINGAAGAYGSTIKAYSITTSPSIGASSAASMQTGTINLAGTITITGKVTDSRGRTASKTATINVYPYAPPTFTPLDAYRCTSNGVRNDTDGTYVRLRATFGRSALSGSNNVSCSVTVKQVGGSYTTTSAVTSGTGLTLGGGIIAIDATFTATFTVTDTVGSVTKYIDEIPSAAYILHVKKGGKAIGFGMAAGADNTASFGWPVILNGGLSPLIIPDNANLNNYTNPGMYYCPSNASAGTISNTPTNQAFSLWVGKHAGAHQMVFLYYPTNTRVWVRNYYSGSWGSWSELFGTHTTIPLANGGTGQTTAQGTRNALGLGNTTGALPIGNGGTGATNVAGAVSALGLTGALVVSASGNSGNHHYLRFSNGLQVCYGTHSWSAPMTTALGSIYLTNTHGSFSFPVAFTSVISATGTKRGSVANSGLYRMNASTTGLSGIAMFRGNSASATALQEIDYIVLGKWK